MLFVLFWHLLSGRITMLPAWSLSKPPWHNYIQVNEWLQGLLPMEISKRHFCNTNSFVMICGFPSVMKHCSLYLSSITTPRSCLFGHYIRHPLAGLPIGLTDIKDSKKLVHCWRESGKAIRRVAQKNHTLHWKTKTLCLIGTPLKKCQKLTNCILKKGF